MVRGEQRTADASVLVLGIDSEDRKVIMVRGVGGGFGQQLVEQPEPVDIDPGGGNQSGVVVGRVLLGMTGHRKPKRDRGSGGGGVELAGGNRLVNEQEDWAR